MARARRLSGAGRPRAAAARRAGIVLAALCLGGCGTSGSGSKPPAPPPAPRAPSVSYDWHPLLLAPFDTLFHDMPIPLTEVIEFQEPGAAPPREQCFRPKRGMTPPSFLGRAADDYLLCFARDKLVRIEAAVHLPQAEAAATLAAACDAWHAQAGARTSDSCEGRADEVAFSAHLVESGAERIDPDASAAPPSAAPSTPATAVAPTAAVSISLARAAP